MRDGSRFQQWQPSAISVFWPLPLRSLYNTLDWRAKIAAGACDVHELGQFDGVKPRI
jgi:hypothetical protein